MILRYQGPLRMTHFAAEGLLMKELLDRHRPIRTAFHSKKTYRNPVFITKNKTYIQKIMYKRHTYSIYSRTLLLYLPSLVVMTKTSTYKIRLQNDPDLSHLMLRLCTAPSTLLFFFFFFTSRYLQ